MGQVNNATKVDFAAYCRAFELLQENDWRSICGHLDPAERQTSVDYLQRGDAGDGYILAPEYGFVKGKGQEVATRWFHDGGQVIRDRNGDYETLLSVDTELARYFIAGAFGTGELKDASGLDERIVDGLRQVYGLCLRDEKGCLESAPAKKVSEAWNGVVTERKRAAEEKAAQAKQKAEEEKRAAEQKAVEEKAAAQRTADEREIEENIVRADRIWAKGAKLAALSRETDEGPGGIDHVELERMLETAKHGCPSLTIKNLEESRRYLSYAAESVESMLSTYSGYKTVEEKSGAIGCGKTEEPGSGPTNCAAGDTRYDSVYVKVTCPDEGLTAYHRIKEAYCYSPSDNKNSNDDHCHGRGCW